MDIRILRCVRKILSVIGAGMMIIMKADFVIMASHRVVNLLKFQKQIVAMVLQSPLLLL